MREKNVLATGGRGGRIFTGWSRIFSRKQCVRAGGTLLVFPADSITGASTRANSSPERERVHCPGDKKSEKKKEERKEKEKKNRTSEKKKKTQRKKYKEDREKKKQE